MATDGRVGVAPAPATVTAPAHRQRVSFTAESLFDFDRSTLQSEGRGTLDAFAGKLAGTQYDQITVEGHTDRLGTDAYNQQLSQRRADAVKSYRAADCIRHAPSARLIACLQPERRVDIEVNGNR